MIVWWFSGAPTGEVDLRRPGRFLGTESGVPTTTSRRVHYESAQREPRRSRSPSSDWQYFGRKPEYYTNRAVRVRAPVCMEYIVNAQQWI